MSVTFGDLCCWTHSQITYVVIYINGYSVWLFLVQCERVK